MRCLPRASIRLLMVLLSGTPCVSSWALDWEVGRGQWTKELGLGGSMSRNASQSDLSSLSNSSYSLDESLRVSGSDLYVLTPRLVNASVGLNLGFNQYHSSNGADDASGSSVRLLGYNLSARILELKPYPIQLYASRNDINASSDYGGRSTGSSNSLGFKVALREDNGLKKWLGQWFKADLSARQEQRQETTTFLNRINYFDQTRRSVEASVQKGFTTADLWFRYRAADQVSANQAQTQTQFGNRSQSVYLNYNLDFGPKLNRTLDSTLTYDTLNTELPSNTLALNERVHIDHFRNLATDYAYDFNRDEAEGAVAMRHNASFSASHTLYTNLSSSLGLNANRADFAAGNVTSYGGSLSQSYNHSLPGGGGLGLSWNGSYQRNSNALNVGILETKDRFVAPDPADPRQKLSKPFVTEYRNKIKVSKLVDGEPDKPLELGYDYTVDEIDNFIYLTFIYRNALPIDDLLRPGDQLKVSYDYELDPDLDLETYGAGYGVSVSYGWISGSYSHTKNKNKLHSGGTRFLINNASDETVDRYNLALNYGWVGAAYSHQQTKSAQLSSEERFLFNNALSYQNTRAFQSSSDDSVNVYMAVSGNWLGLATSAIANHGINRTTSQDYKEQYSTSRLDFKAKGSVFGADADGAATLNRYRGSRQAYDRRLLVAALFWKPEPNWNMRLSISANNTQYLLPIEQQFSLLSARSSLNWRTAYGWRHEAFAEVRTEQNDNSPRSMLMQLGARTEVRVGKLLLSAGASAGYSQSGNARANSQTISINIRRSL